METSATREILNLYGFHVRPTTLFVEEARKFSCDVTVAANGNAADGKSPMALLALGAVQGDTIEIRCNGADAEEACKALCEVVDGRFGGIE
jgi:phosphotransferase system HPr (HPr) family protein